MMEREGQPVLRNASAIDLIEERRLRTRYGDCVERLYRYQNSDIVVVIFGPEFGDETPVRIHSTCFSAHYVGSIECDCREQLDMTLREMGNSGRGVVVFLEQNGRGNGHAALMRSAVLASSTRLTVGEAYKQLGYPSDARDYLGAAMALRQLGLSSVRLMTNNPKKIAALESAGMSVLVSETSVQDSDGPWLADYYKRKAAEGHRFERYSGGDMHDA